MSEGRDPWSSDDDRGDALTMRIRRPVEGAAILAMLVLALLAGCGGPAPTQPAAMVPSVDAWTHAGLACAGPTPSGSMAGLLAWTCSGTLHGVTVTAALDGDAQGVFLASVSLPAATDHATTAGVFEDLADAMPAYAATRAQVHAWLVACT